MGRQGHLSPCAGICGRRRKEIREPAHNTRRYEMSSAWMEETLLVVAVDVVLENAGVLGSV